MRLKRAPFRIRALAPSVVAPSAAEIAAGRFATTLAAPTAALPGAAVAGAAAAGETAVCAALPEAGDEYLQRLIKLIPTEVLALYLSFKGVTAEWKGYWALLCLLLVVFVRTVGTREAGKPIQSIAVLVAAVSFILWVYAAGGYFFMFQLPTNTPGLISVAIGVWTFLIPFFYKGD